MLIFIRTLNESYIRSFFYKIERIPDKISDQKNLKRIHSKMKKLKKKSFNFKQK